MNNLEPYKVKVIYPRVPRDSPKISVSKDAHKIAHELYGNRALGNEEFHVLYLNRRNQLICTELLSMGSTVGTIVPVKNILCSASQISTCTAVMLTHNHPSGFMQPSESDKQLTRNIKEALKLIDIQLLDHIIVDAQEEDRYYSFADEGQV